ncbi:MAG TPA: AGE family epimerase/isomerase [Bacteroidales bacterium]|nr:AGE family epimerase/isomerase [Bacteroidales bacterium]
MKSNNYSRRSFIKRNSLAGLGAITVGGLSGCSVKESVSKNEKDVDVLINSIAGLTPEQLHERYNKELFNRVLPAIESLVVDHELGGFMCDVDISARKMITTNKKTWYQGRGIWVYSFLYNNLKKDQRYLDIAKKAIDFILKLKPVDDNFWNDLYSKEGSPVSGPGDIYGDLFVAEGLAEYSKATGDKQYLKLAKEIIFHCLERYDRPDYIYDISYAPGKPKVIGPRVLGHWMIFLSLSTQILNQGPDEDFKKLADRCIDSILNYHLNAEYRILNEVINHDLTLPANEYSQFSVIGHGIETLAFVMAEAVRRNDAKLFETSSTAFRRHVEVAADKLYGGFFEILYNADNYTWAQSKSAWCQQETLIGTLIMIEHTGDRWARDCFTELDAYVQEKMVCPDLAFWTFGGGRKVINPTTKIVEHYHTPRHLMKNMLALERIIKREGKISGQFA